MSARAGEEVVGRTAGGVAMVLDRHAADRVDRSRCGEVDREYARIMRLDPAERRRAWTALSPSLRHLADHEGSWKALEQVYTRDAVRLGDGAGPDDGGVARAWWDALANAVGVRERGNATRELVRRAIVGRARVDEGREVRVASIAAGSARHVLEALRQVPAGVSVRACLLDWDKDAARYSRRLAGALGVDRRVEAIVGNAIRVNQHFAPRSLDIVEAVGILDYLADKTLVLFLRQLRRLLREGGVVIAANILPNEEREFLHTAMGWRAMHYRTEEDFVALFLRAGFAPGDLTLHRIPAGLYAIVEATLST